MKAIELTEEHKTKLLEMCKKLFPDYTRIIIDESNMGESIFIYMFTKDDVDANIYLPYSIYGSKKDQTEDIDNNEASLIIHWFEFCITHLTTKMYNISQFRNESTIKQLRGYLLQEVEHPIDYLYEEFKKLK